MAFNSDLITVAKGKKSILAEPLSYTSERLGRVFTVPKGFPTDFASIPRLAQLIIPKMDNHRAAATLHDYLYSKNTDYLNLSRVECDRVFLEAMTDSGTPAWKRWAMYNAVRMGGWVR